MESFKSKYIAILEQLASRQSDFLKKLKKAKIKNILLKKEVKRLNAIIINISSSQENKVTLERFNEFNENRQDEGYFAVWNLKIEPDDKMAFNGSVIEYSVEKGWSNPPAWFNETPEAEIMICFLTENILC